MSEDPLDGYKEAVDWDALRRSLMSHDIPGALRRDREDLVQETLLRILHCRRVQCIRSLEAFGFRVLRNVACDRLRRIVAERECIETARQRERERARESPVSTRWRKKTQQPETRLGRALARESRGVCSPSDRHDSCRSCWSRALHLARRWRESSACPRRRCDRCSGRSEPGFGVAPRRKTRGGPTTSSEGPTGNPTRRYSPYTSIRREAFCAPLG